MEQYTRNAYLDLAPHRRASARREQRVLRRRTELPTAREEEGRGRGTQEAKINEKGRIGQVDRQEVRWTRRPGRDRCPPRLRGCTSASPSLEDVRLTSIARGKGPAQRCPSVCRKGRGGMGKNEELRRGQEAGQKSAHAQEKLEGFTLPFC